MMAYRIRKIAQISGDRNLDAFGAERESDRIGRVMRDGETGDVDIADREAGTRLEQFEAGRAVAPIVIPSDGGRRHSGNVNRNPQLAREDLQTTDVIGMLMGNQDRGQRFRIAAGRVEAFKSFFTGKPGIDQETGSLRSNQRTIAGARRRENRDFYDTIASQAIYYYNVLQHRAKVSCVVYDRSMKARVFVSPKTTVLDPQGQTIRGALNGLGHASIAEVRQGKFFEIELKGDGGAAINRDAAMKEMDQIARDVLSNPVIEDYRVEFFD
jgi:phosphoribosylformylglycinamidine synthase subunit PurS